MLNFLKSQNLEEIITKEQAKKLFLKARFPDGMYCPYCYAKKIYISFSRDEYKCSFCKYRFSLYTNTIFENTKLGYLKLIKLLHSIFSGDSLHTSVKRIGLTLKPVIRIRKIVEEAGIDINHNNTLFGKGEPVVQLKDGKLIKEFRSLYQAFKITGVHHISECLHKKRKSAGGFIWKRSDEYFNA